jgi:hypothetical protein
MADLPATTRRTSPQSGASVLDHIIVLGKEHLRRILKNYADYYNGVRTHRSLNKDAPVFRRVQRSGVRIRAPYWVDFIVNTFGSRFSVHTACPAMPGRNPPRRPNPWACPIWRHSNVYAAWRALIRIFRWRKGLALLLRSKPARPLLGLVGPLFPFDAPCGRGRRERELLALRWRQATRDHLLGMIYQRLCCWKKSPNSSRTVARRRGKPRAIWTVCNVRDRLVMAPENGNDISTPDIPNSRCFVVGRRRNPPSVRGERHLSNDLLMPSEFPYRCSRIGIPYPRNQIERSGQNALSVGAKRGA